MNLKIKTVAFYQIKRCFSEKGKSKLDQLKAKLEKNITPNTPLGIMDRIPKKSNSTKEQATRLETDVFARFPNNTNPKTGEINGPTGPEPTRYGDWEKKGRCSDF